jgi:hypothetical protein
MLPGRREAVDLSMTGEDGDHNTPFDLPSVTAPGLMR